MKIDLHTHILPKEWPDLVAKTGYKGWPRLEHHGVGCAKIMIDEKLFREVEENCWNPEARLKDCERTGVNLQVLSTVPVMFAYWAKGEDAYDLSRFLNDHIASIVRRYPTRFAGLGTLPMREPELAVKELERCVKDLGLRGVEIGTHIAGKNLDKFALFPIFAKAEELGAAIFIHPWEMMGQDQMPRHFLPWLVGMPAETTRAICSMIFGGILERLPLLKVGFAHGGGSFAFTLGRIEAGYHARPDLCQKHIQKPPRTYLNQMYFDTLVHDADALRFLIQSCSVDRLALGSDYPFPLGEDRPGHLIESMQDLSPRDKKRLLGGTALEFLGLTERFPATR